MRYKWTASLCVLLLSTAVCSAATKRHVVKRNENLWKIAKHVYGKGTRWRWIWWMNRATIRNPDLIRPGMVLIIPKTKPKMLKRTVAPPGYVYWKTVVARVTAYTPGKCCCRPFADGRTSTGRNAWRMRGCAVAPVAVPYGTWIDIPGIGWRIADDTGSQMRRSARRGIYHIDIRMRTYRQARKWGRKWLRVTLWRSLKRGKRAGQGSAG